MLKGKVFRATNVLGLADVEIELGKVTVVEGGNGQGKTSILEGVKALMGGGYDASLVREGADHAEMVLVLDDETEITKRIRKTGGGDTKVRHPDFGNMSAPATFLAGITDAMSFNPVSFLTAKDRTRALLEALPMKVAPEDVATAVAGTFFKAVAEAVSGRHAIEAIELVRKQIFDERTAVNRTAKDQRRTADGLRGSLPDGFESGVVLENQLQDARSALRDAESELTRQLGGVDAETEREIAAAKAAVVATLEQKAAERDRAVDELRQQIAVLQDKVTAALRDYDQERGTANAATLVEEQRIRTAAQGRKDELLVTNRPRVNDLSAQVTRFEEQLRAADRNENTRKVLAQAEAEAGKAEEESKGLTEALDRLDLLRDRLMAEIPIAGVTIKDGEVLVDGHPFARVNRARQVRVAVELARLRAGKLPLVCVDELECLDRETFDAFVQELAASDLQAIVTRVTEGPLAVRRNGAAVPVGA